MINHFQVIRGRKLLLCNTVNHCLCLKRKIFWSWMKKARFFKFSYRSTQHWNRLDHRKWVPFSPTSSLTVYTKIHRTRLLNRFVQTTDLSIHTPTLTNHILKGILIVFLQNVFYKWRFLTYYIFASRRHLKKKSSGNFQEWKVK